MAQLDKIASTVGQLSNLQARRGFVARLLNTPGLAG